MKTSVNRIALLLGLGVALCFWSLAPGSVTPIGDRSEEIAATQRGLNVLFGELFTVENASSGSLPAGFLELIVHVPFVLAARALSDVPATRALILSVEPVLLSTLLVLVVFVWSHRLTGDRLRSVGYALVAAFCTMIWPYAYFGMEVQQSLFLLLAAFMVLAGPPRRGWRWWILFGICCGMVISVKPSSIILAPVVVFLMIRSHSRDQENGRVARLVTGILITATMFAANTLWRNRMGTLIEGWTGFLGEHVVADPLEWAFNVVALISSPGKGLIVYVPVAVVAAILFRRAWDRHRDLAIFGLLTFVSLTAALAAVDVWSDETWGPRHLHALAAPLVILVAASSRAGERLTGRAPVLVAALLGFCVSFLGAFYHYGVQQRVAEVSGQSTLQTLQMNSTWNHIKFNGRLLRVWLLSGDGGEFYWNPEPIWYYDIPEWSSRMEAVRIDPYSQPQPLLIEQWGARVPGLGWLSVFLSLLAGPALIVLCVSAARKSDRPGGGGSVGLVWSIGITIIYLCVCLRTLYTPFGPGHERAWAIPLAIMATVIFAAYFFARAFVLRRLLPLLILVAAIVILVRSGSIGAFLVAALLFVAAIGFGDGVMRLLGLDQDDPRSLGTFLCRLMVGFGVLGVAGFLLAIMHVLYRPAVVLLASGVFLSVPALRKLRWKGSFLENDPGVPEAPALLAMGGYMMLLNLAWAVAPEIQFDALNYHMHVAAAWARAGRAVDLLHTTSYLAGLVETVYSMVLVLSTQTAAKMLTFALGLITAGFVFVLTHRVAGRRAASWAALLFYSVPLIMWSSSTTDVELALSACIATLVLSLILWHETRLTGWLYVAALIFGTGVAIKPTMALVAPAFAGALILYVSAEKGAARFRTLIFVGLIALAMSVPWYALRQHFTGNPFYPVLNEWFPVHRYVDEEVPPLGGSVRVPATAATLIRFPFMFTFATVDYSESGVTSGGVGPYLLLAIPLLTMLRGGQFPLRAQSAVALTYVVLWTVLFSYARFFVPIIPVLVSLAVAAVMASTGKRTWLAQAMFVLIFAGQALSMPVQFWSVSDRIPIRNALGLESDDEFLSRVRSGYAAVSFLNHQGKAGDTAIGLGIERVRYYLNMPFHSWREMPEVRAISHLNDEKRLAEELARTGYDWLVIDESEPRKGETYLRPDFLECFAELQFQAQKHSVYRLVRSATPGCVDE